MNRNAKLIVLAIAILCVAYPLILLAFYPADDVGAKLFKQDIDLAGGTSLVYRVDNAREIDSAISVLRKRLDPLGTRNYGITRSEDRRQIEITIPGTGQGDDRRDIEEIETVKSLVTRTGLLVFRVLATPQDERAIELAQQRAQGLPLPANSKYAWVQYRYNSQSDWEEVRSFLGFGEGVDREQAMKMHAGPGYVTREGRQIPGIVYVIHDKPLDEDSTQTKVLQSPLGASDGAATPETPAEGEPAVEDSAAEDQTDSAEAAAQDGEEVAETAAADGEAAEDEKLPDVEVLVRLNTPYVTGADFDTDRIQAGTASDGTLAVDFELKPQAQEKFRQLTGENVNKRMGIVLDRKLQNAPSIGQELSNRGQITGYKTPEERNEVMTVLLSGMLDIRLTLESQRSVGSELGTDNARNGLMAAALSVVVVLLFMGIYYRKAGLVANLALLLNLVIIVLVMHALQGAWSLPGIAGLVLTIGMSVDANVLIFERIREEMSRGSGIRLALRNGYARAWPAIFDGNLTTFLTAAILFKLGGADIKGFAMVLIIGILSSMFTALLFTRVIFEMLVDHGLLRRLPMFQFVKGTSVQFVRIARVAIIFSAIAATAGIVAAFATGDEKYAMQFRGGSDVELRINEDMPVDVVRQRVSDLGRYSVVSLMLNEPMEPARVEARIRSAAGPLADAAIAMGRSGGAEVRSVDYAILLPEASAVEQLQAIFPQAKLSEPLSAAAEYGFDSAIVQPVVYAGDMNQTPRQYRYRVQVPSAHVDMVRNALAQQFENVLVQEAGPRVETTTAKMTEEDVLALQGGGPIRPQYAGYLTAIRSEIRLVGGSGTADKLAERIDEYLTRMAPGRTAIPREIQPVTAEGAEPGSRFVLYIHDPAARDDSNQEAIDRLINDWDNLLNEALGRKPAMMANVVSPRVGDQAWQDALIAIVVSLIVIIAYIWLRFAKVSYGLAAVIALVHDVAIAFGLVLLFSFIGRSIPFIGVMRIDLAMIGAFLTLIGYSLNDTIVIFDRIRENRGKFGDISETVINNSINQTLSRTILTSFTTLIVVIVLYFFGGVQSPIHGFAFVLMVGVIVGTYSSIVMASPLLLWLRRGKRRSLAASQK